MSATVERYGGCDWKVTEHRIEKETGEHITSEHIVSGDTIKVPERLFQAMELGREYKYAYIVRLIVNHYRLNEVEGITEDQMIGFINGGKYRAKYYFPLYYYPLKVFESEGKIIYYGRGGVSVLDHTPMD